MHDGNDHSSGTLWRRLLGKLNSLLSRKVLGRHRDEDPWLTKVRPVFIVGAPRSGSTILYQTITAELRVAYINNLSCTLHNSLPFGFRLSRLLFMGRSHRCFSSRFGDTRQCGWNAPSECGEFWYRWLDREQHFVDWADMSSAMVREIRHEIGRATRIARLPLVFKNLNAGQRLRLISSVVPDARIIHIRRDPVDNVRSILKSRKRIGVKPGRWWSIRPPGFEAYLRLPETELCAAQLKGLTAQIEADRHLFPESSWLELNYEEFVQAPRDTLKRIAGFLGVCTREHGLSSSLGKRFVPSGQTNRRESRETAEIRRALGNENIDSMIQANTRHE